MNRLYDQQLKQDEQIRELQAMIAGHAPQIHQTTEQMKQIDRLVSTLATLGWNYRQKYLTISSLMSAGWSALRVIPE